MCTASNASEGSGTAALEPLKLEPVDRVRVTVLIDNYGDVFAPSQGPATRKHLLSPTPNPVMAGGATLVPLVAEHGFSALVEVETGSTRRRLLFDTGVSPGGLAHNLSLLDINPLEIDAIVLSHGHFDHTGGFAGLAERYGSHNLPILVHPHAFRHRRLRTGNGVIDLPTPSRRYFEQSGFQVSEAENPSFLLDGSVLVTGEIERKTSFETGFAGQEAETGNGWIPDQLVLDDQALVISVRNLGLVVITGCGHAGIINTCQYARYLTGQSKIAAAAGGFHLSSVRDPFALAQVVEAFEDLDPGYLMPGHCTGLQATFAMMERFGSRVIPSLVGTTLTLG